MLGGPSLYLLNAAVENINFNQTSKYAPNVGQCNWIQSMFKSSVLHLQDSEKP